MELKTQLHHVISKTSYSSSQELPFHGTRHGASNTGTEWIFISVPMIQMYEELTKSFTINLPQGTKTWTIQILSFVDDRRHYVNNLKNPVLKYLLQALEKSVRAWDKLLTSVGGQLEMENNTWYFIEWDFDSKNNPYIKEQTHPLTFLDANGNKTPSKQLQPNEPTTYLGVTSQVNSSQEAQYHERTTKAQQSARKRFTTYISHYYSYVYNNCSSIPKIIYPLAATSLTSKQFNNIHAMLYSAVITSKGFNKHWSKQLRRGQEKYSGIGLLEIEAEQGIRKI